MAELGAGAGTGYPGAVDTRQTYVNAVNPIADSNSRMDQEVLNDILTAIVAIEAELGTIPSGDESTLKERLRVVVGNWEQQNVPASQVAVVLKLNPDNTELVMAYNGSIVAISIASTEARTAGTLTVDATINGAVTGLTAVLDATNPQYKATTQAKGADSFTAGQRVGVKITTDAGWLPTTADIIVILWVDM